MATHDQYDTQGLGSTSGSARLERLSRMDDFQVAEGFPDIRGWEVRTADGTKLGKVDELIVDTAAMRVRYIDVDLDRSVRDKVRNPGSAAASGAAELGRDAKNTLADKTDGLVSPSTHGAEVEQGHTLLPIGGVRLDDDNDDVLVDAYTLEHVLGLPRYDGAALTPDYEQSLRGSFRDRSATAGTADSASLTGVGGAGLAGVGAAGAAGASRDARTDEYDDELFDDNRPFAGRRQRLTLAEERLDVSKRQVQAGEVELHKTVETERVQERVPLVHDEVQIERHPLTGDAARAQSGATLGEESIRVPLMAEEVVMQKRVVPREEVIVRKRNVTEQHTVEGEVRRERLDTSGLDQTRGVAGGAGTFDRDRGLSGAADRATNSGPLDRLADKADDLKDRVDGNPASRPGPDATDRRI